MSDLNIKTINLLHEYRKIVNDTYIVSLTDPLGRIVSVNKRFCTMSGYSEAELIGKQHNIIRHPSTPKETFKGMWQTITNGKRWHGIMKNLSRWGESYVMESTISPLWNAEGEISGYISFHTDITRLHDEQRELLSQSSDDTLQKRYAKLLESIPLPAAILDQQSNVEAANEAFAMMFHPQEEAPLNLEECFIKEEGYLFKDDLFDWKGYPFCAPASGQRKALIKHKGVVKEFIVSIKELPKETSYLVCLTPLA